MLLELFRARESDRVWIDALRRAVYQELFQKTFGGWDEARHLRHCESCWRQGGISIVEAERVRVGMIQIFERHDAVEIGEIQIQPESQGQGIGSQLLKDVIARTHGSGRSVTLSVGLENGRAVDLYERLGFRRVDRSDTHYTMCHPISEA